MECNTTKRIEEIEAMKAIYIDEFMIKDEPEIYASPYIGQVRGCITIDVLLEDAVNLVYVNRNEETNTISIEFIPPITLEFSLGENYPTEKAPDCKLCCSWLSQPQLLKLKEKLHEIWRADTDVILFKWVMFLKGELLRFLEISESLDIRDLQRKGISSQSASLHATSITDSPIRPVLLVEGDPEYPQDHFNREISPPDVSLFCTIRDYNESKLTEIFQQEQQECLVCYTELLGKDCVKFSPCNHIFCKPCLKSCVEIAIKDGHIENIRCMEYECYSPLQPNVVQELVSAELFAKYDALQLKTALALMDDVVMCPFRGCDNPVIVSECGNLAQCAVCLYAFCPFCKRAYHGVEPCPLNLGYEAELVKKYLSETREGKLILEGSYGKKHLANLVNRVTTRDWIENNCKICPRCKAKIEKNLGCNRMRCWRCKCSFCWLCSQILDSIDPLEHSCATKSGCTEMKAELH